MKKVSIKNNVVPLAEYSLSLRDTLKMRENAQGYYCLKESLHSVLRIET